MFDIDVQGIDETKSVLIRMSDGAAAAGAISAAANEFKEIIAEATPEGYSRRLPRSVASVINGESALVGYEPGVEVAGNPEFDSIVRRPRKWTPEARRTSVRRDRRKWISVNELESVLQEAASFSADRVTAAAAAGAMNGIS